MSEERVMLDLRSRNIVPLDFVLTCDDGDVESLSVIVNQVTNVGIRPHPTYRLRLRLWERNEARVTDLSLNALQVAEPFRMPQIGYSAISDMTHADFAFLRAIGAMDVWPDAEAFAQDVMDAVGGSRVSLDVDRLRHVLVSHGWSPAPHSSAPVALTPEWVKTKHREWVQGGSYSDGKTFDEWFDEQVERLGVETGR